MRLPWMVLALVMCSLLGPPATAGARSGSGSRRVRHAGRLPCPIPACGVTTPDPGGVLAARCRPIPTPPITSTRTASHLVLQAIQTDGGYTSGRIKTQGQLTMVYGRVEARIQMPPGPGTLPAFWLLGSDYPERRPSRSPARSTSSSTSSPPSTSPCTGRGTGREYRGVALLGPRLRPVGGLPHLLGGAFARHDHHRRRWHDHRRVHPGLAASRCHLGVMTSPCSPSSASLSAASGSWAGTPPAGTPFPQQMVVDWFRYTP